MLQAFGDHAKGESPHATASSRFWPWVMTPEGRHLGEPAAIALAFDFNRERHVGNVPFRAGCLTRRCTRRRPRRSRAAAGAGERRSLGGEEGHGRSNERHGLGEPEKTGAR